MKQMKPLKKAGFKEGDKIVSVEGKNIYASSDLISEVQSHKSGDTITVTVERDGQNIEIKTVLD
jgi:S1-C subfamily serine protease